jgi:methyl-CpG-binding domain protein 4|tara:strand:- start:376 stop:765 length:390 start_codon:yes stop_codon:yes gene_type:complete
MREDLMVQQQVKSKWQHMVGVMCLNLTYRKQVKEILPKLFNRYPNPKAYLRGRLKTQQNMLKPLGMWEVRSKRLRKMSKQFLTWNGKEASDLHGIGKYGSDSYKIFYKKEIPANVQDKELKKYLKSHIS